MRRLFRNLLDNAARHGGGAAGEVTVSLTGNTVHIAVCDRGPGVPEADAERIVEPFFRARGVAESAGGVGLSLALVRQIAEQHGGTVSCHSRKGGGACFEVRLPAEP